MMRRIALLLLIGGLTALSGGVVRASNTAEPTIIIGLEAGQTADKLGLRVLRELGDNSYLIAPAAGQTAAVIAGRPGVRYVADNHQRQINQLSYDPYVDQQWGLQRIDVATAWARTRGGGVIVAVIDSGVDAQHPDLIGQVLTGYDARFGTIGVSDSNGHGTSVAGIIAARADNGSGGAGVCPDCRILPIRACDMRGRCDDAAIVDGIRYAVDNGAQVINLSLGGPDDSAALRDAVRYATSRGVIVVAAAGNEGDHGGPPNYPAAYPDVIAVTASDRNDAISAFSSGGDYVVLAAPGVEIVTTLPDGYYGRASGTSAASPFVAASLALLRAARPDLTADDYSCALLSGTDDLGSAGFDDRFGHGRLNIGRVMQQIDAYAGCPLLGRVLSGGDPFAPLEVVTQGGRYFAETGQALNGSFRQFWEAQGGLAIFGYPISREHRVADAAGRPVTVQYFERHRFEYRPDRDARFDVLLSRIGADRFRVLGRNWFTEARSGRQQDCRYFSETDQSLCGALLDYWSRYGLEFNGQSGSQSEESLTLFGLPISAAQPELQADGTVITVQWFERARLEVHGDLVLGGLLGREEAGRP